MTTEVQKTSDNKSLWDTYSNHCNRDLIIKKIALCTIAAINVGGIAALLTYVCLHYSIPTTALVVSPIIVGVLGALSFLNVPTFGVSRINYTEFTNPAILFSRCVTVILLGPVVYTIRTLDWTQYGDPFVAHRIAEDFKNDDMETLLSKYGPSLSNLEKYGFFSPEHGQELKKIYQEVRPHIEEKSFFKEEQASEKSIEPIQHKINVQIEKWQQLKEGMVNELPNPELPQVDFTKRTTRAKVWMRRNLKIYA